MKARRYLRDLLELIECLVARFSARRVVQDNLKKRGAATSVWQVRDRKATCLGTLPGIISLNARAVKSSPPSDCRISTAKRTHHHTTTTPFLPPILGFRISRSQHNTWVSEVGYGIVTWCGTSSCTGVVFRGTAVVKPRAVQQTAERWSSTETAVCNGSISTAAAKFPSEFRICSLCDR